jgi:hypothetical protein
MVFYLNTDSDTIETIKPQEPEEDRAILLAADFKYLKSYDFRNFNYYTFEQDIIDMSPPEFEWWYQETFQPWLQNLNEDYLDIDYDHLAENFSSQAEKRVFMLKIINFAMFLLPYELMKKIFKHLGIDENYTAQEFLVNDDNLFFLREEIISQLDKSAIQVDEFVKTLRHFEKIAKKNLVEENIALLDEHIQKQNFFIEIFKKIIQETDMFKLREFILRMLDNDSKNIL